jgi:SAM-dependent methyltransferase
MTYAEAHVYLHELCRVLKPGGVLRISTPHLAREAREYVRMVDLCLADPSAANDRRYELAVRALIDQFTRQRSGGELIKHFHSAELDRAYALERYGDVWREFVPDLAQSVPGTKAKHWIKRVGLTNWRQWRDLVKLRLLRWLTNEHSLLEGENEKWEWDSYSLGKACRQTGLVQVSSNLFNESRIPGWNLYQLDTSHDGLTAIEHSLYLEAVKPK